MNKNYVVVKMPAGTGLVPFSVHMQMPTLKDICRIKWENERGSEPIDVLDALNVIGFYGVAANILQDDSVLDIETVPSYHDQWRKEYDSTLFDVLAELVADMPNEAILELTNLLDTALDSEWLRTEYGFFKNPFDCVSLSNDGMFIIIQVVAAALEHYVMVKIRERYNADIKVQISYLQNTLVDLK